MLAAVNFDGQPLPISPDICYVHPMLKKTNDRPAGVKKATSQFTLGPTFTSKLNAVEGIKQSTSSREMFVQFELDGLSPAERRRAIVARHEPKG